MGIGHPHSLADVPTGVALFRCPLCKDELEQQEAHLLVCQGCGARWPIRDGIPCFALQDTPVDYGLAPDMKRLVNIARQEGWSRAVEVHVQRKDRHAQYAREYVTSEARADFRFLMDVGSDATVLDIGAGWGNISTAFARACKRVFALDTTFVNLCFVQIRARQEALHNVVPVMGDAACLALPPSCCDAVLMVGVLEWVAWGRDGAAPRDLQLAALREALRVLRPGGQLYIGIENRFSAKSFIGAREPHTGLRFISLLPRGAAQMYSQRVRGKPFREWTYSRGGLRRLLGDAGFAEVRFYYPIPSYQNVRYFTDYSEPWISRFLITRFMGHGRFGLGLRLAARIASLLRIEKWSSPCFSVLARKADD